MLLPDIATIRVIITHADCPDGLASAILLHDALPTVPIRFLKHGTTEYETLQAEPGMLFADICPPVGRLQEFVDAGAFVLDHHKGVKNALQVFGDHLHFADETEDPGVSGAMLCYRHVWCAVHPFNTDMAGHPIEKVHTFAADFARLAGIRDTWQRNDPSWRQACEQANVLMFMPRDRWLEIPLMTLASQWDKRFGWVGETLFEKNEERIERAVEGAHRVKTIRGTRLVIMEGTTKTSDGSELIGDDADLVAGFSYFEETTETGERRLLMVVSTRSRTTYNCAELSKFYGGGGHTKAAGFRVHVGVNDANPFNAIEALVTAYEVVRP